MTYVPSEPNKIHLEDVQFSASVSEAVGSKIAGSINYIFDQFDKYSFGISGATYSGLATYPYVATGSVERVKINSVITNILFYNEISGTSGTTSIEIQRKPTSGSWATIFSVNPTISNTASDDLFFTMNDSSAPSGVTLPVLVNSSLNEGDLLRFVLVSGAASAQNLKILITTRPA